MVVVGLGDDDRGDGDDEEVTKATLNETMGMNRRNWMNINRIEHQEATQRLVNRL